PWAPQRHGGREDPPRGAARAVGGDPGAASGRAADPCPASRAFVQLPQRPEALNRTALYHPGKRPFPGDCRPRWTVGGVCRPRGEGRLRVGTPVRKGVSRSKNSPERGVLLLNTPQKGVCRPQLPPRQGGAASGYPLPGRSPFLDASRKGG